MRNINAFLIFITLLIISSCNNDNIYEKSYNLKGTWNRFDTLFYDVQITDTSLPYNFFIDIRNNNNYNFSNLYVFFHTTFPDDREMRDTIEFILAADNGRWLGRGIGDVKENNILIRKGLIFPVKGIYRFGIEQAMRQDTINGIEDIGIRIEQKQPPENE